MGQEVLWFAATIGALLGGCGAVVGPIASDSGEEPDAVAASPGADAASRPVDAVVAKAGPAHDPVDGAAAGRCAPTGGGPHWVEEGRALAISLSCATGLTLPGGAFSLSALPAGAAYRPADATLTWTPKLDQAGVYTVMVTAPALGESGEIRIAVADRFDDPGNVPIREPAAYTEEMGLPVFHLEVPAGINFDTYVPSTISYRGKAYRGEVKYRGVSSSGYPKKNYSLRFAKEDKFNEPTLGGGLVKRRKIALITTFDDNSYVRWRLAFELWNRMDPANMKIRHFSAVVYVNGKYVGLYTASDKIDDTFMQAHGLSEAGNLYMGIAHDANLDVVRTEGAMGTPKSPLWLGYTKKEGLPAEGMPGAFDDLADLLKFVGSSSNETFAAQIGTRMELREVHNWLVMATAIVSDDTYAKNAFLYHDPVGNERWRLVLWDFNASWGQGFNTGRRSKSLDPQEMVLQWKLPRNHLWQRLWKDPVLQAAVRARYAHLLKTDMPVEAVSRAFETFVEETAPSARRDERRWAAPYKAFYTKDRANDLTSYEQEVAYLRQWIKDRWAFLRSKFP